MILKQRREKSRNRINNVTMAFGIASLVVVCYLAVMLSEQESSLVLLTALNSNTSSPGTMYDPNESKSKNEQAYDAKYWQWQEKMNKFGAAYKGDIIRHLFANKRGEPVRNILEFGSSGGYILASMNREGRQQYYGVEINPSAKAFAEDKFVRDGTIHQIFTRIEDIPQSLTFDVIYTTSVLEHVDAPLYELQKLRSKLAPDGILIVGLKNDGVDLSQTFDFKARDPNHHIYTWNPLLLANMLDSAGYKPCNVIGQHDAWHSISVSEYERNKYAYCVKGLAAGKANKVYNMWAVAVHSDGDCGDYKAQLNSILNCKYLKNNEGGGTS